MAMNFKICDVYSSCDLKTVCFGHITEMSKGNIANLLLLPHIVLCVIAGLLLKDIYSSYAQLYNQL